MKRGLSLGDIASVTADNISDGVYTQVRAKRNKQSKKTSVVQSQINVNRAVDGATDSVICQPSPDAQPNVNQPAVSMQRDEMVSASVETLEVKNLKITITELTNEI